MLLLLRFFKVIEAKVRYFKVGLGRRYWIWTRMVISLVENPVLKRAIAIASDPPRNCVAGKIGRNRVPFVHYSFLIKD